MHYLSFTPETTYWELPTLGMRVFHARAGNPTMNAAIAAPTIAQQG